MMSAYLYLHETCERWWQRGTCIYACMYVYLRLCMHASKHACMHEWQHGTRLGRAAEGLHRGSSHPEEQIPAKTSNHTHASKARCASLCLLNHHTQGTLRIFMFVKLSHSARIPINNISLCLRKIFRLSTRNALLFQSHKRVMILKHSQ